MANIQSDRNRYQINRLDNRGCFVEVKSDWFTRNQMHFEFATYDTRRPEGQRYTNHVHIYLDGPKFLALAHMVMNGVMLNELRYPTMQPEVALFENMGGTSAEKFRLYGSPRPDGMGQSRIMRIHRARKRDSVILVADNGPGEANKTGLVVPKFGNNPENHVSVTLDYSQLLQLIAPAHLEYTSYCSAMIFQRTMNGDYQQALNYGQNKTQEQPQAGNWG